MTCPVCSRETDPKYRPFCSRRCADVDLGRWLTESYRVPAEVDEEGARRTEFAEPEEPSGSDPAPGDAERPKTPRH